MPITYLKRTCLILFILTLWGCAHKPPPLNLPPGWVIQKQQLEQYQSWQLRGKLAYKRGDEAFSANLRWQESPPNTSLRLFNTLGITLVDLSVTPEQAVLDVDDQTYTDSNAQDLLLQTTGWDIPVNQLQRWIKGLPDKEDTIEFNENGTIKRLVPSCQQCGKWIVEYNSYLQSNELVLPSALTIRDISQSNAFIKVRISTWR
jgi:outer membrane lipoprotein LolB